MSWISTFVKSILRDAPIVGYGPYLTYRFRSFRKDKTPISVEIAGQKILVRPATPDLRVAFQSLGKEFDGLKQLLPHDFDGLIIDAGGYIGTAALKLSAMYPQAQIVTIEPSEDNLAMLEQNIAGKSKIHPVQAALTVKSGEKVSLFDRGHGDWGFSLALREEDYQAKNLGTVSTITLEDILARFPGKSIGLVKLDIEGGERPIFQNPSSVLCSVPAVFVELHDRVVPGCSDAFEAFNAGRWVVRAGGEKYLSLLGQSEAMTPIANLPEAG